MTATLNGKPTRKQLSDQLDRLDGIIDILADALPQAVADACKEGAKQAVKEAVTELLANPDVRNALIGSTAPNPVPVPVRVPGESQPSVWQKLTAKVKAVRDAVVDRAKAAAAVVSHAAKVAVAVLPLKRIALVAGIVGVTVGLVSLICPPVLAAAVTAVGGAVATAFTQVTGLLRRHGVLAQPTD